INLAAEKFPNGSAAKNKFLNDFSKEKDLNEKIAMFEEFSAKIKNEFEEFSAKAKSDRDISMKDYLLNIIAFEYARKKEYEGIFKYYNLISNKSSLANIYNSVAWDMVLKDENLDFASKISKKSLDLVKNGEK